jgi:hypothetical protein
LEALSIVDDSSEALTIQISESLVPIRRTSNDDTLVGFDKISSLAAEALALPGAALNLNLYLQNQGICIPGFKSHDAKSCWCAVREELVAKCQLWDVNGTPASLLGLHVWFKDAFGSTVLHLLAASGATSSLMTEAIKLGVDPNAQNTAGETFLHVLHPIVFRRLAQDWGGLEWNMFVSWLQLLNRVHDVRFNQFDHLGRSFYHIISRYAKDSNMSILSLPPFTATFPSSKDVSGWEPHPSLRPEFPTPHSLIYDLKYVQSGHDIVYRQISRDVSVDCGLSDSELNSTNSSDEIMIKHARLLETAHLAFQSPRIREAEGATVFIA